MSSKLRRTTRCLLPLLLSSLVFALAPVAYAEPGLQSELTAISGQGTGHIDVSPTAHDLADTAFIAQGTAEIHDALPDTTYLVQRAVDFQHHDGVVCNIAPAPPRGWLSLTTFTTSEAGAGAGHFVRHGPPPPVPAFDVIFRVVKLNAGGSLDFSQLLMSDCMVTRVK